MAIWSSNKLNRHQPRERLVRLAMTSVGCVAAGYVVLGLTGWLAPPPRTAVQAAQPPASVDAQTIRYPSAGGAMIEAYIARPEGASRNPAVIVVLLGALIVAIPAAIVLLYAAQRRSSSAR